MQVTASKTRPSFCRSTSEIQIEKALERGDEQENLIGDFTRPFILPLVVGRHSDLRSISPCTVSCQLMSPVEYLAAAE